MTRPPTPTSTRAPWRARRQALLLHVLAWWLPADIGAAVVGDLAEEAPARSSRWLLRQTLDAAVRLPLARVDARRAVGTLVVGGVAAAVAFAAGDAAWHGVLALVPRRAGHDPGLGWRVAVALCAGGVATAASWGIRTSRRDS